MWDFEYFIQKMFHLWTRVWIFILGVPKLLLRGQTLGAKSAKKCYHIGTLEAFHLLNLGTSEKAKRSTSRSPPIKFLDFLHLLTDTHSLKTSLLWHIELLLRLVNTEMGFYALSGIR